MGASPVDAKRIGVTGWRGRLGSELVRRGCIPLKCDVTDPMWISAVLDAQKPDVVIHCAAMTDVDGCEDRPLLAAEINTHGTWQLAQMFWGPIVYLSTDYIFDGKDGPYSEEAPANPLGMYGWSKLGGELAIKRRQNAHDLIVRTTVLFDCYSENFVTTVTRKLLNGERLVLPFNLTGSPTYVPHLADGILAAIHNQISGTINLVGSDVTSRYKMVAYIAQLLEVKHRIESGPLSEGAAPRPLNAGLRVEEAQRLGLPIGDPKDGIKEVARHALETVESR